MRKSGYKNQTHVIHETPGDFCRDNPRVAADGDVAVDRDEATSPSTGPDSTQGRVLDTAPLRTTAASFSAPFTARGMSKDKALAHPGVLPLPTVFLLPSCVSVIYFFFYIYLDLK